MRTAISLLPVTVEVAGRRLGESELSCLSGIRIQERLSLPSLCELTFLNQAGGDEMASLSVAGVSLRVTVANAAQPLFEGEVTAVEFEFETDRASRLRIRGYDRLHRLRKRQTSRGWSQIGLTHLARDLVSDLGLSVRDAGSDVVWQRIIQHGQTDFELLAERAERCGLYFVLHGGELRFTSLAGFGEPVTLTLGESLLEARVEINGDASCRSVSAEGWDPLGVSSFSGGAGTARTGREIAAEVQPGVVGGRQERKLPARALQSVRQAEALAQAELDARVAREVTFRGLTQGNPALRPGGVICAGGLSQALNGRYILTEVTHTLEGGRGFFSEISTAPAPPGRRPGGASMTLGVVTRADDPDHLGRVRASLPGYGGVETDWMQVAASGAGANKGLVTIPDTGDNVLVLCADEDPCQGVVVGGLYGAHGPPIDTRDNHPRCFSLVTAGGQRVQLDADGKSIRFENGHGSYVELGPEKSLFHSSVPLHIQAPGQTVAIRGKAIDFEEA